MRREVYCTGRLVITECNGILIADFNQFNDKSINSSKVMYYGKESE